MSEAITPFDSLNEAIAPFDSLSEAITPFNFFFIHIFICDESLLLRTAAGIRMIVMME